MTSDKPDGVQKWRKSLSAVTTIGGDTLSQRVIEDGLRVTPPLDGHRYAAIETDDGHDLYRTLAGYDSVPSEYLEGTDPAANVECSDTVPAGYEWLLEAVTYTLVCDANVANRIVVVQIKTSASGVAMRRWQFGNLTASQTGTLNIYPGAVADTTGTAQGLDLGFPVRMPAGSVIYTATTDRQATDNFAAPVYHVRRVAVP